MLIVGRVRHTATRFSTNILYTLAIYTKCVILVGPDVTGDNLDHFEEHLTVQLCCRMLAME